MEWQSYAHPISDVRDWSKNNRLELRPDFQRNEVWSKAAKIMLIDTILKGIPIPKIYIKSIIKEGQTYRIVIDGQQRLTAILEFVNDRWVLGKPYQGEFERLKFSKLPPEIQNAVLRYKIDINEIFNPTEEEIRDLYARVNKYTVQLNKQELRKADFPGDFIKCAETLSELNFFEKSKMFSIKQRRRMLDVEYIEELLAIIIEGVQDKKETIDDFCEVYSDMGEEKDIHIDLFNRVLGDIELIFEETTFPIYETRFKQKSDFYSLFSCISYLHKEKRTLQMVNITKVRERLDMLDQRIDLYSDEEKFREYATRCLSDANSSGSRKWRELFLREYLEFAYIRKEV